mgnify:CR=1 FL=1
MRGLCFLGAGDTHNSGQYKDTVKNGLRYLKQIQDPEGCFGPRTTNHFTYNHAIAALAMTEAYALLAVAAWETGHLEDARWALREARERGAEMTALAEMIERLAPALEDPLTGLLPPDLRPLEVFNEIMFDGSSIAGWKGIQESDMVLMPEADTAVMDPFADENTLIIR